MSQYFSALKKFFIYLIDKNVARHSQALSFATVLCIVPIITIFIGFIGSSTIFFNLNIEINNILNYYLLPTAISSTFNQYLKVFSEQASHLKLIGIIFFIISILILFSDMETSFSDLVDSPNQSGITKTIHRKIINLFFLFFAPIVIFSIIGTINWISHLNIQLIKYSFQFVMNYSIFVKLLLFTFLFFWFSLLFFILPRKKMRLKNIFIGSSIASTFFIITQNIFSYYISQFASYQIIYGVFSIIPIFLLWIYLNWQITFYSLLIANFIDNVALTKKETNQDQE